MANIILRPDWYIPERLVTSEAAFLNRRKFLKQVGVAGAGLLAAQSALHAQTTNKAGAPAPAGKALYPAAKNKDYPLQPGWRLSDERVVASFNNFYEFSLDKERVKDFVNGVMLRDGTKVAEPFQISPWSVKVEGMVEKPRTLDLDDLLKEFTLEERVYRFRCVEAWSMIVPWTGFPLSKLIEKVKPKSEAKFVRFETFNRPEQAIGMKRMPDYPWPYFEGLRMDEAMHPLTMVVTGMYGKPLPKQNGAPIRIVVPWKYGYKSIKSIVKIQFQDKQPTTFWETLQPEEYPFESNVNPKVPHPRWSQATERLIDSSDRVKTLPFNGYGDQVAKLYQK